MSRRPQLGAVILAGSIEVSQVPVVPVEAHVPVPAVHRSIRSIRRPLDLAAQEFRYRIGAGERIAAIQIRRGARTCREPHRNRF